MKKILLSLLLLCAAATTNVYSKNNDATIFGHVVDSKSGEHLPYATITLKNTTIGTMTDLTGHYMLKDLPLGEFTVVASSVGYGTSEMEVTNVANKSIECKFNLEPQSIAMDQVIVSSSRTETNRRLASTIVNIASDKIFENTSSSNLSESMNFQPGIRTENTCGNCGSSQLRINGLEGQYSQILLDSRPIFSSLAAVYGLEQLPTSMIERVEVIRGGGSALYGSSAIAGVVNIITKEPLRNSVTISNTTGVLKGGTTDITNTFNGSFVTDDNKAGIYLFGMMRDKGGYDRNGDGFTETPELNSETMGFRGYYKTSPYTKLTAEYHHITEYRRGGDQLDEPAHTVEIAEQLNHVIDGGGLTFDILSPSYKHKTSLYTSIQSITRDSFYGTDESPDAYGNTEDLTFVVGGQYTYSYNMGSIPSNFTAGAEYSLNNLHDVMVAYDRDLKQDTDVYGVFAQNEWVNDKFNFIIGGRLDKHNLIDNPVFSPRVSARYSPTEKIGLRASYSSGYRAPQAFNEDLHIEAVGGGVSLIELDPDLKPEYSHSFTASTDLYHTFGEVEANLLVEGFYTRLEDVFVLEEKEMSGANTIWERTNGAAAIVRGVSADLRLGIYDRFDVQLGYTFQKSNYTEEEQWSEDVEETATKEMFRSPDQYGYIMGNYNVTDRFTASVFGNYTGTMLVQHAAGYIETDRNEWTPDFWDMGFKLTYDLPLSSFFNIELHAGMKNIFDSYQDNLDCGGDKDAGYVYGPVLPRTVFFGAKLNF